MDPNTLFINTASAVIMMLLLAVPGFVIIKSRLLKADAIPIFAKFLMYACQAALIINPFIGVPFDMELLKSIGIFLLLTIAVQFIMMGAVFGVFVLFFKKKLEDARYRVAIMATYSGNVAFMGIPLINAILKDSDFREQALIMAAVFSMTLVFVAWTFSVAIVTRNPRNISARKALLNPVVIPLVLALIMFCTTKFFPKFALPGFVAEPIDFFAKMTTPMCMTVLGMRLATMTPRKIFGGGVQYLPIICKQLIFPVLGFAMIFFLPVPEYMKWAMLIMCAAPIAAIVLNFAEMIGEGQEAAAQYVLLGTLLCAVTTPVMVSLLGQFI